MSERDLLRELRGELSAEESADLRRRLAADPELRARGRRLAASWEALAPPPEPGVPPGFAQRIVARARADRERRMSWVLLPAWAKMASALALAVGLVTGFLAGARGWSPAPPAPVDQVGADYVTIEEVLADAGGSPAESYLAALEREDFADGAGTETR